MQAIIVKFEDYTNRVDLMMIRDIIVKSLDEAKIERRSDVNIALRLSSSTIFAVNANVGNRADNFKLKFKELLREELRRDPSASEYYDPTYDTKSEKISFDQIDYLQESLNAEDFS